MIRCDVFDVQLQLTNSGQPKLQVELATDLLVGTRVLLSSQRTFVNKRNEECLWIGWNDAIEVKPISKEGLNGFDLTIDILTSDEQASRLFRQINKGASARIKSPVSETLTIVLTVGGRQRLSEFGRNNVNLQGSKVSRSGEIHVVVEKASVCWPLAADLQPKLM